MATLIMMVGPAGSGKSTWIQEYLQTHPKFVVVSTDDLRRSLTGNVSDNSRNAEIWSEAKEKVKQILVAGRNAILDSTMVNERDRASFLSYLGGINFDLKYKIIEPAQKEELVKRIEADLKAGKDRSNVPHHVIERQLMNFYKDVNRIDKDKIIK